MSPFKPKHPCSYLSCGRLTSRRFCEEHERIKQKEYDEQRLSSSERGYDGLWHKVRNMKLNQYPLCEEHLKKSHDVPATLVHHIKPIDQGGNRLSIDNLMSLCNDCHEEIHKGERFGR